MEKYQNLDGLRAYAALGIVIMHVMANMQEPVFHDKVFLPVISSFAELTLLFFIISSFSLCCGYYDRFASGNIDLNRFYQRRFLRILPFFALMTVIDVIFSPSCSSLAEGITNMSMVFGLLPNPDIHVIGVGWFVGVIFVFYLIFPFFCFLFSSKRKAWISITISIILYFIACNYWMTEAYLITPIGKHNIIYSFPFFAVGGLIYLYRKCISTIMTTGGGRFVLLTISIIGSLGYFFVDRQYNILSYNIGFIDTTYEFTKDVDINLGIIHMLFVQALWVIIAIGPKISILSNKLVNYLSGISMELYLSHMMCFRVAEKLHLNLISDNIVINYVICCVATITISILFSHIVKYKVLPMVVPHFSKS